MFNAIAFNQREFNGIRITAITFTRARGPRVEPPANFSKAAEPTGAWVKPTEPQ